MFTLHTYLMYVGTLDQLFIKSIIELSFKQLRNTYTHLDPRARMYVQILYIDINYSHGILYV